MGFIKWIKAMRSLLIFLFEVSRAINATPSTIGKTVYSLFEFEDIILVQRHVTVFPREANGKINFRKFTRSYSEEDTSEPSRRCNYGGANSVK